MPTTAIKNGHIPPALAIFIFFPTWVPPPCPATPPPVAGLVQSFTVVPSGIMMESLWASAVCGPPWFPLLSKAVFISPSRHGNDLPKVLLPDVKKKNKAQPHSSLGTLAPTINCNCVIVIVNCEIALSALPLYAGVPPRCCPRSPLGAAPAAVQRQLYARLQPAVVGAMDPLEEGGTAVTHLWLGIRGRWTGRWVPDLCSFWRVTGGVH